MSEVRQVLLAILPCLVYSEQRIAVDRYADRHANKASQNIIQLFLNQAITGFTGSVSGFVEALTPT